MEHLYFVIFNFALLAAIWYVERKNIRKYALLSAFTVLCAAAFENITTYLGFWYYYSEPKLFLVSLYTLLLYMPYVTFCYFAVGRLKHE